MKKFLLIALLLMSAPALAEEGKHAGPPSAGQDGKDGDHEQKFAERKAEILKHMSEHIAEMQKKQACVQAAKEPRDMKECFPRMEERMEDRRRGGGRDDDRDDHGPEDGPERK